MHEGGKAHATERCLFFRSVAHNVGGVCQFRSASVRSAFEYSGVSYVPFPLAADLPTQSVRGRGGLRAVATTREQTIVDCLSHPDRCGGTAINLFMLDIPRLSVDIGISYVGALAREGM